MIFREKAAHPEIQVLLEAPDRPAPPDLKGDTGPPGIQGEKVSVT